MPILKMIFLYILPGTALATYSVLRLGNQLPVATRRMGQRIGVGYQIFKAIMKVNLPTDIVNSNQIVKLLRQTDQQANAFHRELRTSVYKMKEEIKEAMPSELKENPFRVRYNIMEESKQETQPNEDDLILDLLRTRHNLTQVKKTKQSEQNFQNL